MRRPSLPRRWSLALAGELKFGLLAAQSFPNCGDRNDQQNEDGEAHSDGEAANKQNHSLSEHYLPSRLDPPFEKSRVPSVTNFCQLVMN